MQAEKRAREKKETVCRQKGGHESERKPHAGRKAGTRTKGNRVPAEKQARERKETACRQKSGHERKRKPHAGRKAGTREKGSRVQAEKQAREKKRAEQDCRNFSVPVLFLRRVHIALSAVVQKISQFGIECR